MPYLSRDGPFNVSKYIVGKKNTDIWICFENANFSELLTSLTRIGKFTKYFVLGDPMQTDLKHKEQSGFKAMFDLFNDEESKQRGIHCVEFTKDDIMRSEILKFIIDKVEKYNATKK